MVRLLLACFILVSSVSPAFAYIGPGLGAGTIAVVLGVIASLFLALFAILWYPVKRIIKKRKGGGVIDKTSPEVEQK